MVRFTPYYHLPDFYLPSTHARSSLTRAPPACPLVLPREHGANPPLCRTLYCRLPLVASYFP